MFGALAGRDAPRVEAGERTPTLGVMERIDIDAYLLSIVVLAVSLLRREPSRRGAARS